tara:strand:- start:3727 stop:4329 length:603 start_codon:yes stop_codon:yes gene_type:complete
MNEIIIIGCGGHATSIIDLVENSEGWIIKGFIAQDGELKRELLGYNVMGFESDLAHISKDYKNAVIGVGQIGSSNTRQIILKRLKPHNLLFPSIKSKFSYVSKHSQIGEGTTIGHGAIINSNVKIGNHCIINSASLIEHDSSIGDFCHISTGTILNGNVHIGKGSFIGSGAIIREGITIPENSIVSAGKRIMGWPPIDQK